MPIGLLAPLVFRSLSWQKALVLGASTGLTFELMELIFRVGIFDVDDVMTNALGVMLGYGVLAMFKHRVPREALHVGECDTPGTIRGIAFSSS